jgi:hypothetical protein
MMLIAMLSGSSPSTLPQLVMLCQVGLWMVQWAWVVHLQMLVQASLAVYNTVLSVLLWALCMLDCIVSCGCSGVDVDAAAQDPYVEYHLCKLWQLICVFVNS